MRMVLAGGGTGGHLFPAVALAERLLAEESDSDVLFVGTERGIEARILPELGFRLETVDIKGFSGRGVLAKIEVMVKLLKSVSQGMTILNRFAPQIVVGVGGYASAPVVIAAKLKGIPVVLHEQNAIPGLANRFLGRWANKVCVSFEQAMSAFANAELTGNPIRSGMEACPKADADNPTLLVFGGSRGAQAINEAVCAALPHLASWQGKLEIIHQTGEEDLVLVKEKYAAAGWENARVVPFINDMAAVYRPAHLVLCRAGATTIAELTACGRPSILIPYPHAANDHQRANAAALAATGAAILLEQGEASGARLAALLDDLFSRPQELDRMAEAARDLGKRGAAEKILSVCRQVISERKAA